MVFYKGGGVFLSLKTIPGPPSPSSSSHGGGRTSPPYQKPFEKRKRKEAAPSFPAFVLDSDGNKTKVAEKEDERAQSTTRPRIGWTSRGLLFTQCSVW